MILRNRRQVISQTLIIILSITFTFGFNAYGIDAREAKKVAEQASLEIMSPFCPGRSLRDCPSGQANELRADILERAKRGDSKEKILADLTAIHGDKIVRNVPEFSGIGALAWFAPLAFLLIGSIIIVIWLSKKSVKR